MGETQYLYFTNKKRQFSTEELAMALGLSFSGVHQICKKLGLKQIEINPKKFRWDYSTYIKVKAYVDTHRAVSTEETNEEADERKLHPLVTNYDFFKLTYFPDSEPEVFKSWED